MKFTYLVKRLIVAVDVDVDKESRSLIHARIVADIMDGYFWVRGCS